MRQNDGSRWREQLTSAAEAGGFCGGFGSTEVLPFQYTYDTAAVRRISELHVKQT